MEPTGVFALCVCILTWNVGISEPPQGVTFEEALSSPNCGGSPHIYVVGLQGVNRFGKSNVASTGNGTHSSENPWVQKVVHELENKAYVKIQTAANQGMMTMIFVKRSLLPHIKNVAVTINNAKDNTGGVSIRINLFDTSVAFVNAHLPHGAKDPKTQLTELNNIWNGQVFKSEKQSKIRMHDFVFWFGDHNFGWTGQPSVDGLRKMIGNNKLTALYKLDQLNHDLKKGKVLRDI